jgi:hypothetical protein
MTHDINSFVSYVKWENGQYVYLGDNSTHEIIRQGDVSIQLNDGDFFYKKSIACAGVRKDLFLVKQFDQVGCEIIIKIIIF